MDEQSRKELLKQILENFEEGEKISVSLIQERLGLEPAKAAWLFEELADSGLAVQDDGEESYTFMP